MKKRHKKLRKGSKQSALVMCLIAANVQGKIELETQLGCEARVGHPTAACLSSGSPKTETGVQVFSSGSSSKV